MYTFCKVSFKIFSLPEDDNLMGETCRDVIRSDQYTGNKVYTLQWRFHIFGLGTDVCIAMGYGTEGRVLFQADQDSSLLHSAQTGTEAHPAS
jgi:hypothetical protein